GWAGVDRSTPLSMVTADSTAAAASRLAQITMAVRKLEFIAMGSRYAAPVSPTASGSPATAISPAARATALLTPLAVPAWRTSALARTVAVRGATVADRPRPKNSTAGK